MMTDQATSITCGKVGCQLLAAPGQKYCSREHSPYGSLIGERPAYFSKEPQVPRGKRDQLDLVRWPFLTEDGVLRFTLDMEPMPKDRPIFSRANGKPMARTSLRTRQYERQVFMLSRSQMKGPPMGEKHQLFGVKAVFYRRTQHAVDLDNLMKALIDGLGSLVWHNDSQVREMFGALRHDPNFPRTEAFIYRVHL